MAGLFDTQTLASIAASTALKTTNTETESTPAMTVVQPEMEEDYSRNIQNVLVDNITMIVQTQMTADIETLKTNLNQMFLLLNGSLIILMQAGFGFLEAGSVRSKNVTNILIKNFADLCMGAGSFLLFGYAFAFGAGSQFIGYTHFGLIGLELGDYAFMFFQCTFAATSATIVSGAIAERCNFNGYIIFSVLMTGVVYPIHTHWAWGGGWLAETEFHDFAGSAVVHLSGGAVALVGALMLGPRMGRFTVKGKAEMLAHSIPLVSLGAFILIFGFFAFNGGSQASITSAGDGGAVSRAVVSTLVSCCVAGTTVLFANRIIPGGKWSLLKVINGCLIGMVSVCAGCNAFQPWAAAVVSCLAAFLYLLLSRLILYMGVDDPVDAVAIHAGGGIWGVLAAPIFMDGGLVLTGSNAALRMLLWNAAGASAILAWNVVCGVAIFGILKAIKLFRVDEADEVKGLDIVKHNEPAYPKDVNIEEEGEPVTPITAAFYRDEMINFWAKRASVSNPSAVQPSNLSGMS